MATLRVLRRVTALGFLATAALVLQLLGTQLLALAGVPKGAAQGAPLSSAVPSFSGLSSVPVSSDQLRPILLQEVKERLERLSEISDVKGSLQRTFLSPAGLRAGRVIDAWMQEAGMRTWTDGVGNVHGRIDGHDPSAPALLLGSHMDTVMDAGKFDGLLGIVSAIGAVKAFVKFDGVAKLKRPVEVIAFSDEEGVRFQSTFLGSSAVAGTATADILQAQDSKGVTFAAALDMLGLDGTPEGLAAQQYDPRRVWAYVEAHIEQGPVLEEYGVALGVVPAISGQTRLRVAMEGEQGHAGTVPMRMRRDPMAGAAEAVVAVEATCQAVPAGNATGTSAQGSQGEADVSGLVCTVGQMEVWPGASNVIPGKVSFSVDIRARADSVRQATVQRLTQKIETLCARRHLTCRVELKHQAAAVECSPDLVDLLAQVAGDTMAELGEGGGGRACAGPGCPAVPPVPRVVSGAGHDAMAMAHLTKVAMVFVRCKGGLSHRPDEFVGDDDLLATSAALLGLLRSDAVLKGGGE